MSTSTASRDDLVAMAAIPLTRPGESTVPVRMQTEHLAAVEHDLEQRGVPAEIVEKYFLGLHRCDELPLELWVGMITDAYNLATATAAAPSYVAALAIEWAASNPLERWVNAAPDGPGPLEETISEYLGDHNPFPDESRVDVLGRDAAGWVPATIVERAAVDEWTVEYDDGGQVWRDHQELRPHSPEAG
jgi:hypothetical protein